jgi:hypothetical protein
MVDYPTRRRVYLALLLFATATAGTWRKDKPRSTYSENLATHRRTFEVATSTAPKPVPIEHKKISAHMVPIDAITDQLEYLLARKKAVSEHIKYVHGYTIQVYTGGNREEAFKIRSRLHTRYSTMTPWVSYDLPRYTVRVGRFLSKLEAYPAYAAIRKHMPQAIIRPICFPNRPYMFSKSPQKTEYSLPVFNE